jgi:hypothetical protein
MGAERIRQRAADDRLAGTVGFWWGLAEGVAFFIVPDVYISFAALFSLRAGAIAWAASIAGSLLAILTIWGLMSLAGANYLGFLDAVPGISSGLIRQVRAGLENEGLPYTPFLVLGGVPLKLYGAAAFTAGHPLGAVLLWTGFARVVRIAPTFLAVTALRAVFRPGIERRPGAWLVMLLLFWAAFYTLYFRRMAGV